MNDLTEGELLQWIRSSVKNRSNIFSYGYQGNIYIYENKGQRLIIKAAMGWGAGNLIRRAMLYNEYRVYSRLSAIHGIPRCFGFLKRRYLVLQFLDGVSIRNARIRDRELFFERLLNLIKALHKAGVAHGDLKKKDNLLVVEEQDPYVIDFGVAIVRKPGFAPLNHFLYNIATKFDFNAWAKLKYNKKYDNIFENITDEDRQYYNRTGIEKITHRIKRIYRRFRRTLS